MRSFSQFGNDLYTGELSYNIVGRRKLWYLFAIIGIILAVALPMLRGGFNLGIEFRGGSEFRISNVSDVDTSIALDVTEEVVDDSTMVPQVTVVGDNTIRVQTERVSEEESLQLREALAKAYDVKDDQVTASYIDARWGSDVTGQAVRGLIIFVLLAGVVMALYFRTWKMSLAAMVALLHDLVMTAGIYGAIGFEVTPAAVIGFLTILGYSLYDTVVVFDKIRENTEHLEQHKDQTFSERVNLAVNQTLVRSINTSVVALLPVSAILFIGAFLLGAGTLRDISLALLIGMLLGTYSTIFIASPMYAHLREKEPAIAKHDRAVLAARQDRAEKDGVAATEKKGSEEKATSSKPNGKAKAKTSGTSD